MKERGRDQTDFSRDFTSRVPAGGRRCLVTLTPDYPPCIGGIQLLLKRLLDHLPGWDHVVISRGATGAEFPEVRVRTKLRTGPLSLAELNARALAVRWRRRPDAVLNGHVVTTPSALLLGRRFGVPVYSYLYADEIPARPWLSRQAVRRSTACIAVSGYTRDLAVSAGADPRRLHVIPPGVDQLVEPPVRQPSGAPTLITVARLADRYKGHDVVMEAMPAVIQAVPGARWIVVGDGPLRPELEDRMRALGLDEGSIVLTGAVSSAKRDRLLAEADVFVMPSRLPP